MSEEFDKILSKKIKDSIETNKISYNPEHWQLLKKKQQKKKRRMLIWWRVAAVLVLGALIGTFISYFSSPINIENIKENEIVDTKSRSDSLNTILQNNSEKVTDVDTKKIELKQENYDEIAENSENKQSISINEELTLTGKQSSYDIVKNVEYYIADNDLKFISENSSTILENLFSNDFNLLKARLEAEKKLNDFKNLVEETIEPEDFEKDKIQIGVLVSSMTNVDNQYVNETAGFSSGLALEIPIVKNVEIYTGAVYSNQNFNVFNQNPGLIDGVSSKGNQVVLKSRVASVQSIEIPINIKYNFKVNAKKLFVAAGISSTQYFNEEIEATYLVNSRLKTEGADEFGNNFIQYELTQNENIADTKIDSNKFELLSMLNFSVGIAVPFNSGKQELIIEPFFKQSLSSLTSQKVNFSNAGVQLRYNFSLKIN
jgi:hypothetical protein